MWQIKAARRQVGNLPPGSEQDIDILFTDVRMPGGMNGLELACVTKRKRPQFHVIVTSGFYEREELPKGANFLSKPWSAFDLISAVVRAVT
jgi:YesN/AraC family two-component response regulator